jgi:vesicular inhibitory amino acid transporter
VFPNVSTDVNHSPKTAYLPNWQIYRDMRHPYKYKQALKLSFSFTVRPPLLPLTPTQPFFHPPIYPPSPHHKSNPQQYILDAITAIAGLLMFGDDVRDAITSNILAEASYPRALTALMCLCIGIIPLTKIPLNARPIVSTVEVVLGVSDSQQQYQGDRGGGGRGRAVVKGAIKIGVVVVFLGISIVFPAFDSIMAFMGSALCFTICVT